jgi:hypothetical protein
MRIHAPIIGHVVVSQKIMAVPQRVSSQWGRCDRSNPDSKHIVMYLKELCSLITNKHLAESSSFLSVIGGETYTVVVNSIGSCEPLLQIWDPPLVFACKRRLLR